MAYRRGRACTKPADLGASARFTAPLPTPNPTAKPNVSTAPCATKLYSRPFTNSHDRAQALPTWIHTYTTIEATPHSQATPITLLQRVLGIHLAGRSAAAPPGVRGDERGRGERGSQKRAARRASQSPTFAVTDGGPPPNRSPRSRPRRCRSGGRRPAGRAAARAAARLQRDDPQVARSSAARHGWNVSTTAEPSARQPEQPRPLPRTTSNAGPGRRRPPAAQGEPELAGVGLGEPTPWSQPDTRSQKANRSSGRPPPGRRAPARRGPPARRAARRPRRQDRRRVAAWTTSSLRRGDAKEAAAATSGRCCP